MTPNYEMVWAIIVACFGGIARYLDQYLHGKHEFHLVKLVATIVVTGFTGWLTAEIVATVYPSWKIIAAGIGGYAGSQIMEELIRILKLRLGAIEQQKNKE